MNEKHIKNGSLEKWGTKDIELSKLKNKGKNLFFKFTYSSFFTYTTCLRLHYYEFHHDYVHVINERSKILVLFT